jgi:AraC family transcriptional regulator
MPPDNRGMPLQPRITEVERLLFRSDTVAVGAFRCPARHPLYVDSGPASGPLMVFPRTSTMISYAGGHSVTGAPPTALFYNEGQAYRRRKIDDIDASDWFMIDPGIVREVVERYDPSAADRSEHVLPFAIGPASPRTYLTQRRLHTLLSKGEPIDGLEVEETVIDLFRATVREACSVHNVRRRRSDGPVSPDVIERVKASIAVRPSANPSLKALSTAAGCSPFQLCREFRAATGYTLTQYRHTLRLRLALDALRHSTCDLTDLALGLGYSSHSHFTLAFRRQYAITPSQFRSAARS